MFEIHDQTIILTRGDTAFIQPIPKVKATGEPYAFQEGDAVKFRLKECPEFGKCLLEKDCDIDVENNTCILHLDPEDTEHLSMQEYRYEFKLVTAIGEKHTFIANQTFIIGKELESHE